MDQNSYWGYWPERERIVNYCGLSFQFRVGVLPTHIEVWATDFSPPHLVRILERDPYEGLRDGTAVLWIEDPEEYQAVMRERDGEISHNGWVRPGWYNLEGAFLGTQDTDRLKGEGLAFLEGALECPGDAVNDWLVESLGTLIEQVPASCGPLFQIKKPSILVLPSTLTLN